MIGSKRIAVLLLCVCISSWWSHEIRQRIRHGISMVDFGAIYYGARCVKQHKDPYDAKTFLQEFKAEGGSFPVNSTGSEVDPRIVTNCINLPTTLLLATPIAMLPRGAAQILWIVLTTGLLAVAASFMWDLGANTAPAIWACLAGFILANCEQLLVIGNVAGIAVSLCVVAAWCFLRERYAMVGVFLLAISLVLKPQDAGFVWLYFLLTGGELRRRALQTLAVVGILGLFAAIWIAPSSPHWIQELHRNLAVGSARGGVNDPGLSGISSGNINQIVDLQAALSVFRNDPRFYDPVSYLVDGFLILIWALVALTKRSAHESASLAIAAISVLCLLPVYHRTYDAKLLLLTLPACALLWKERGPRRWIALALTSVGILLTSDIPIAFLLVCTRNLSLSTSTVTGKVMTMILLRPIPLVLLATGSFYLWVYAHYSPSPAGLVRQHDAANRTAIAAAK
ncbi:MAG: glycosyltransferase family 87 protein [Acidobacteriota bacterium]